MEQTLPHIARQTCVVVYFRRHFILFVLLGTRKVVHRGSRVAGWLAALGAVLGYLCIWDTTALEWQLDEKTYDIADPFRRSCVRLC